jgi:hypothetical protein
VLLGRQRECEMLDRVLQAVGDGESQVLVVRGEAGIGKVGLVGPRRGAVNPVSCPRCRRCRIGDRAAFSGLHQLCMPVMDRLDRVPPPQRDALGTAFGLIDGPAPDRFLLGLALLSLL